MDNQLLEDYKAYYRVRMERYEGNTMYPHSYLTEKALFDAMNNAQTGHDFKKAIDEQKLNIKNAIALVKDQETARLAMWRKLNEPIRALSPERIIAKIDTADDAMGVAHVVQDVDQEVSVEISIDGFMDNFYGLDLNFKVLEDIEVSETAEVPDKWKNDQMASAEESRKLLVRGYDYDEEKAGDWQPGWKFNYDLLWEERHRRKIPVPDEQLQKRIDQVKQYRGK